MAVFRRLSESEITGKFTHYARFVGMVPCYFNVDTNELQERNWIPEACFWLANFIFVTFIFFFSMFQDDDYDPEFPITLVSEIERREREG